MAKADEFIIGLGACAGHTGCGERQREVRCTTFEHRSIHTIDPHFARTFASSFLDFTLLHPLFVATRYLSVGGVHASYVFSTHAWRLHIGET